MPREAGSSRAILLTTRPRSRALRLTVRLVPTWALHLAVNRFLDSDLVFLHYQDRAVSDEGARYVLPASANRPVAAWRALLRRYGYDAAAVGAAPPSPSRKALLDRWHAHVLDCRHCAAALRRIRRAERFAVVGVALGLATKAFRPAAVALLAMGALQALRQRFDVVDFQYTDGDRTP